MIQNVSVSLPRVIRPSIKYYVRHLFFRFIVHLRPQKTIAIKLHQLILALDGLQFVCALQLLLFALLNI